MAFCHRMGQSKLKLLSHQLKRCYFQVPFASLSDYISRSSSSPVLKYPFGAAHKKPIDFCNNVRFYAAPYLAKAKKEEKAIDGPRMNEQIQAKFVRLVTDKGHNIVSIREALEQAKKLDLDLVEVQRKVDPPVCKIMDYHREKYIKQVKEKDRAKSKKELTLKKGAGKEVRFSGKTEHKDLKMKADAVKRLMERGYRVKCVALASRKKGSSKVLPKKVSSDEDSKDGFGDEEDTFERRGGEDEDLGALLSQLTTMIEDVSIVESGPRVETKQAYVIVRHVKFGPSKKGGAKKLKDVQTAQPTAGRSGIESPDMLEYGSETEEGISSDEEDLPDDDDDEKTRWSVTDSTNDFEEVFNFNDSGSVPSINPKEKMKVEPRAMSSHSRLNISDFSHPRPAHDFKREDGPPSSPPKTSFGAENRYGRNEARDRFPPTSEPNRGLDKRDSKRYESAMSNQRRQPPSEINGSPPIRDRMQVGTDSSSAIKNIKLPHNDTRKQEPPPPGHLSAPSASSYGIFSSPKASPPSKQGVAAVGNQEKGGGPHETARNPYRGGGGFGRNPNIPCSNTNGGHDRGGQGGWGVFSRDS